MRLWLVLVAVVVVGCGGGDYVPRPTFSLLIPQGDEQWKQDLSSGFEDTLAAYGYESRILEYSRTDPDSILDAAKRAPRGKRTPVCIVFTRRDQISPVVAALIADEREVVTVGVDDASIRRAGHVGMSAENMAYTWKIRYSQLDNPPKLVLIIFGNEPIKTERVQGSMYARSGKGAEFSTRFRDLSDVTREDVEWAEMIVPIGADAYELAKQLGAQSIYPISGADTVLTAIERGEVMQAITDEPYQIGLRSAQMVRDFHLESVRNPVISLPYGEVDLASLRMYRDRRYHVPPTVPVASDGK